MYLMRFYLQQNVELLPHIYHFKVLDFVSGWDKTPYLTNVAQFAYHQF